MATTEIRKEEVKLPSEFKGCLAFVLYNVFTKEECDEYIQKSEKKGYEQALLNIGGNRQKLMTDIRNSSRCIWDSVEEVDKIWKRIKSYVPEVWCHRKVLGLNERLRILRYDPGEYFKPHYDGIYQRDNGERSYITIQIYLNEGFKGGSTTFLSKSGAERVEVVPKIGSILVFEHPIFHEGSELISGRKYTIRTDVMFSSQIIKPKKKKDSTTTEVTTILKQTDIDDELSPPESTTDNKPHSGKTIILPLKTTENYNMATTEIRKEDVQLPKEFKDCLAFVLYNVFTEEECEEYINISEAKGYSTALINTGGNRQELMTDIRNNSRCIWDTFEEVDKIWKRIEPFVPDVWNNRKVIGLNERLRILRYDPGEYFKSHYDGCYCRENGERSYVTIQIYLNEGFEGGSTTFLGTLSDERVEVVPKTGSVLIFEHPILHEGSKLISGRKYAIRTDVMYSSKVIRSHKDNESSTKEMTSQDIQNQLEELEEERCKPS